jgi:hypothetical protein
MMTDWRKLKVVDLKAELKRRGLPIAGLKQELVARLEAVEEGVAGAEEAEAGEPAGESIAEAAEEPTESTIVVEPTGPEVAALPAQDIPAEEPSPIIEALAEPTTLIPTSEPVLAGSPTGNTNGQPAPEIPEPELSQDSPNNLPVAKPVEVAQDANKRKRRSASPPPSEKPIARKRAKQENEEHNGHTEIPDASVKDTEMQDSVIPAAEFSVAQTVTSAEIAPATDYIGDKDTVDGGNGPTTANGGDALRTSPLKSSNQRSTPEAETSAMDYERDIEPATHPATSALYIKNFMRPLRAEMVQTHLLELATAPGKKPDEDEIVDFFLDPIKSHAFVVFKSVSAASRVRAALHDRVWPDETNRKRLMVDFVPAERVGGWIKTEESQVGGRGSMGVRWEVIYDHDEDGNVTVELDSGVGAASRAGPRPGPPQEGGRTGLPLSTEATNSIPLGPRAQRGVEGAPLAPRGDHRGNRMAPPARTPGGQHETTQSSPAVGYQPVSDELVQSRLANMRAIYTKDTRRELGNEINRYTFENGDMFVDRGKEIFVGIRPPHREAERRRQLDGGGGGRGFGGSGSRGGRDYGGPPRRRRGGGGPPFRYPPQSDRYYPGGGKPSYGGRDRDRDEGRMRFDDDRGPRYNDDYRDRRY